MLKKDGRYLKTLALPAYQEGRHARVRVAKLVRRVRVKSLSNAKRDNSLLPCSGLEQRSLLVCTIFNLGSVGIVSKFRNNHPLMSTVQNVQQ